MHVHGNISCTCTIAKEKGKRNPSIKTREQYMRVGHTVPWGGGIYSVYTCVHVHVHVYVYMYVYLYYTCTCTCTCMLLSCFKIHSSCVYTCIYMYNVHAHIMCTCACVCQV